MVIWFKKHQSAAKEENGDLLPVGWVLPVSYRQFMVSLKLVCLHYLLKECYLHGGCGAKMETTITALAMIRIDLQIFISQKWPDRIQPSLGGKTIKQIKNRRKCEPTDYQKRCPKPSRNDPLYDTVYNPYGLAHDMVTPRCNMSHSLEHTTTWWGSEIDILESRSKKPLMSTNLHTGGYKSGHGCYFTDHEDVWAEGMHDGLHTYGLSWTKDRLEWYYDGDLVRTIDDPLRWVFIMITWPLSDREILSLRLLMRYKLYII